MPVPRLPAPRLPVPQEPSPPPSRPGKMPATHRQQATTRHPRNRPASRTHPSAGRQHRRPGQKIGRPSPPVATPAPLRTSVSRALTRAPGPAARLPLRPRHSAGPVPRRSSTEALPRKHVPANPRQGHPRKFGTRGRPPIHPACPDQRRSAGGARTTSSPGRHRRRRRAGRGNREEFLLHAPCRTPQAGSHTTGTTARAGPAGASLAKITVRRQSDCGWGDHLPPNL